MADQAQKKVHRLDQGCSLGFLGTYRNMRGGTSSGPRGLFARGFWLVGLVLWLGLAIAFGLHRNWNLFSLSVIWVMASLAGWSHSEEHVRA